MRTGWPGETGDAPVDLSLSAYCDTMLASLSRADQRRWGEVYVCGLLNVQGRKSIRRISDLVGGQATNQSLQQFVNQSPWGWEPVRQALAERMNQVLAPRAWMIREVVFPKNGNQSVGVGRQYASSMGRMINCQRSIAVFLVGGAGICPVNWRLILPPDWDHDANRRLKCRVPDGERSQPAWRHMVQVIAELTNRWLLPGAPVLMDLSGERDIGMLLPELEQLGMDYLVGVPAATTLTAGETAEPGHSAASLTAGGLAVSAVRRGGTTISWHDERTGRQASSMFGLTTVRGSTRQGAGTPRRSRQVLAQWPARSGLSPSVWLTNHGASGILDLAGLVRLWDRHGGDVEQIAVESGLHAFEGRSFPGWHHHVTLVSLAHGFRLLRGLGTEQATDHWLRPYIEA
jgi:hypothetical protein